MNLSKLVKKAGLYFIGNISAKLIAVILIPLYAFFVSSEDLGTYDYAQTIMNILVPVFYFSIWEAILKFLLTYKERTGEIVATTIVYMLLISVFLLGAGYIIMKLTHNSMVFMVFAIMIAYIISYVWQYFARGVQQNNVYVFGSVAGALINLGLTVVFLCVFHMGLYALFASFILAQLAIAAVIEFKCRFLTYLSFKNFRLSLFKEMINFSGPLVLNTISYWFITGYGRLIITHQLGAKMNGLYTFANKFAMIITVVGQVIAMALIEEAVIKAKSKSEELGTYFFNVLTMLFRIFLSAIIIGMPVIAILYQAIRNTEYSESLSLIPFFLLYSTGNILALNVGSVFQAINKTKYLFTTTLLGAAFTVILSNLLLPWIGIYGISIGQICGAIGMLAARYYFSNKMIFMFLDFKPIALLAILYVFTGYICVNIHWWLNIFVLIGMIPVLYKINKKEVIYFIKKYKSYRLSRDIAA